MEVVKGRNVCAEKPATVFLDKTLICSHEAEIGNWSGGCLALLHQVEHQKCAELHASFNLPFKLFLHTVATKGVFDTSTIAKLHDTSGSGASHSNKIRHRSVAQTRSSNTSFCLQNLLLVWKHFLGHYPPILRNHILSLLQRGWKCTFTVEPVVIWTETFWNFYFYTTVSHKWTSLDVPNVDFWLLAKAAWYAMVFCSFLLLGCHY